MKNNDAIRFAAAKGFKVDDSGFVTNPKGAPKSTRNHGGYLQFSVRGPARALEHVMVHRLAAFQKYGEEMFKGGIQVRHLNGNSLDNSASNIAIGTASENMMDKPALIRMRTSLYAASHNQKFDPEHVRKLVNDGCSYREIARQIGTKSKGTIGWIVRKKLGIKPAGRPKQQDHRQAA